MCVDYYVEEEEWVMICTGRNLVLMNSVFNIFLSHRCQNNNKYKKTQLISKIVLTLPLLTFYKVSTRFFVSPMTYFHLQKAIYCS